MIRRIALLAAIVLAACQDAPLSAPRAVAPEAAVSAAPDVIPGQFIVTLRAGEDPGAVAAAHAVNPHYVYRSAIVGFAGSISDAARAGLLRDARVVRVEQDQVMNAWGTQTGATWGLDRVDQHALPLNGSYAYNYDGSGVTAYIIDTGILISHTDFGGRATVGYDAIGDGRNGIDCNGHGTHVSGTVGGTQYGVAKKVTLIAVRVLNCQGSGTTSGVIAGVDWVTAHHASRAVANMSLGGGASSTLDNAVQNSINSGVAYAIAAGNGNTAGVAQDACNYSPARVASAMTIGATNSTDTKASWSNYGSCVDWFAPGVSITSDWNSSTTATNTISGTSMATPHTAGVAALVRQQYPAIGPQAVRDTIFYYLTKGIVTNSNTANNHLLYSLTTGSTSNAPPTAAFTFGCTGLTCAFTDQSSDDGTIASWSWDFGDGTGSALQNPSHSYAAGGTFTVKLTVTDNAGATGSTSKSVSVTAPPSTPITLSTRGYKTKGLEKVELTWSGATTATIDVYRDNVSIANVANGSSPWIDNVNSKGAHTYTYRVCEAGSTTVCSNNSTVTF